MPGYWPARQRSLGVLIFSVGLLLFGACAAGSEVEGPIRPPLDDPPDPGAVPAIDGLDDATRTQLLRSMVRISGTACGRAQDGSGFAIADTLVATNAHVVRGLDAIEIETTDGRRLIGSAVAWDPDRDLAVLRVNSGGLAPLPLGTADDGTIGALFGWDGPGVPQPLPFRIDRPVTVRISPVVGDGTIDRRSWLVAAAIEPGDSGAPLVDQDGVVVGIVFATTRRDAGIVYAVRASELNDLISESNMLEPVTVPDCEGAAANPTDSEPAVAEDEPADP